MQSKQCGSLIGNNLITDPCEVTRTERSDSIKGAIKAEKRDPSSANGVIFQCRVRLLGDCCATGELLHRDQKYKLTLFEGVLRARLDCFRASVIEASVA